MTVQRISRDGPNRDDFDLLLSIAVALIRRSKLETCVLLEDEDLAAAEAFELVTDTGPGLGNVTVVHVAPAETAGEDAG